MIPLPYDNFIFESRLTQDEVLERLKSVIEPKKTFRFKFSEKSFEGNLSNHEFQLRRIIKYQNSFLPRINGRITKLGNRTIIETNFRLHTAVLIFLIIWCTIVSIGFFGVLSTNNWDMIAFPLGMLLFAYGLTTIAFKVESNIAKKKLKNLLEARLIERLR